MTTIILIIALINGLAILFDKWSNKDDDIEKIKDKLIDLFIRIDEFHLGHALTKTHNYFINFFDAFFGVKSAPYFIMHYKVLPFTFFITLLLYLIFLPFIDFESFEIILQKDHLGRGIFMALFQQIVFTSSLIDILSLVQTRAVLSCAKNRGVLVLFLFFLIDIILTTLIALLVHSMSCYYQFLTNPDIVTEDSFFTFFMEVMYYNYTNLTVLTPIYYSPYFTSFIFVFLMLITLFCKVLSKFKIPLQRVIGRLSSVKNPILTLTATLSMITLIIKLIQHVLL